MPLKGKKTKKQVLPNVFLSQILMKVGMTGQKHKFFFVYSLDIQLSLSARFQFISTSLSDRLTP